MVIAATESIALRASTLTPKRKSHRELSNITVNCGDNPGEALLQLGLDHESVTETLISHYLCIIRRESDRATLCSAIYRNNLEYFQTGRPKDSEYISIYQ